MLVTEPEKEMALCTAMFELGKPSVVDFNSVESTSWLERVAAICTISGNFMNRFLVAFCYSFIE